MVQNELLTNLLTQCNMQGYQLPHLNQKPNTFGKEPGHPMSYAFKESHRQPYMKKFPHHQDYYGYRQGGYETKESQGVSYADQIRMLMTPIEKTASVLFS